MFSFGPNSFPANNSVLFTCETQVDYAIKSLFMPIVDHRARVIEVKQSAEEKHTNAIQTQLKDTVFSGDCSNWYIGKHGRNSASWPARAASFWFETYFPDWSAFTWTGSSSFWSPYWLWRLVKVHSLSVKACALLMGLAVLYSCNGFNPSLYAGSLLHGLQAKIM